MRLILCAPNTERIIIIMQYTVERCQNKRVAIFTRFITKERGVILEPVQRARITDGREISILKLK